MESTLSIFPQIYNKHLIICWITCLTSVCFWGCGGKSPTAKSIPPNCPLSFQVEDTITTKALSQYFYGLSSDLELFKSLFKEIQLSFPPEDGEWRITDLGNAGFALAVVIPSKGIPAIQDWGISIEAVSQYRGVDIYQLSRSNGEEIAVAKHKGLLILGRYALQVEQSVSALSKKGDNGISHSRNKPIYVQLDNLLHSNGLPIQSSHKEALQYLGNWGEGIELSISGVDDSLLFKGQLTGMSGTLPALDSSSFWEYVPSDVKWVSCLPLNSKTANTSNNNTLFSQFIKPLLTGHIVSLEIEKRPGKFYVLPIRDEIQGERILDTIAKQIGELNQFEYHFFEARQLLSENLLAPIDIHLNNPFFTLVGNCFLVGEDRLGLEQILARIVVGQVLNQDVNFLSSWNALSLQPSGWYYEPVGRNMISSKDKEPASYRQSLWMINENGEMAGGSVKKIEQKNEAQLLWVADLRADARSGVQLVNGDWNGSENENENRDWNENGNGNENENRNGSEQVTYIVQDKQNWLYHFDSDGQLIWERKVGEPIIGKISALDYFRSGLVSIAFVTQKKLHLIDEHGSDVGNFPIQIPEKIKAPLLVTDIEGNNNYAFFVACENGDIYGFKADGSPLSGWDPNTGVDTSIHALMHVQHSNKDFFLVLNEAGALHAFGRDGNARFNFIDTKRNALDHFYYQDVKPLGRIVFGDSGGMAHVVNLNGDYFRLKLWPSQQLNSHFLFVNVQGDQRKDYWAYNDNRLCVHGYQENKYITLIDTNTAFIMDTAFSIFHHQYEWVGVLSEEEKQIRILLPDASIHPAFPLAGTTAFGMHANGRGVQKVVVGNGAQLYAYQIKDVQ